MSKAWLSVLFVLQLGAGLVLGVASAQQSPPVDVVAPAAMVAAPPVMIAPAASHGLSLPDPFRLDMLIRSTLIALNQANDTGNYTVFRDLGSSAFQGANSAADLAGLFGNLRRQRIDLMPIIFVAPKPTSRRRSTIAVCSASSAISPPSRCRSNSISPISWPAPTGSSMPSRCRRCRRSRRSRRPSRPSRPPPPPRPASRCSRPLPSGSPASSSRQCRSRPPRRNSGQ